MKKFCNISI